MNNTQKQIHNKINVWIIDDTESFCIVLSEILNRSSSVHCPQYMLSCRSAIKELQNDAEPPTVILLDIKMPVMTGLDGIIPLKKNSPGTYIIMLTSYDSDAEIKLALERGANGYLLKTSTPANIIRSIESVVEGGIPFDPHIAKKLIDAYAGGKHEKSTYNLSEREKEIVKLFAEGFSTEEISQKLFISFNTVNTHRRNIFTKLDVHKRHGLVAKAYKDGLHE